MLFSKTFMLIQAHLILSLFALLCLTDVAFFLQIEGKTFHQQKDYDLPYCNSWFSAVVWDQTCSISNIIYINIDLISPYLCQYLLVSIFLISAKQIGIILSLCSFNFNFLDYTIELNMFSMSTSHTFFLVVSLLHFPLVFLFLINL